MKKISIYSVLIIVLLAMPKLNLAVANAGSMVFTDVQPTVKASAFDKLIVGYAYITNAGAAPINVKVKVTPISITLNHNFSVCDFTNCYPPTNKEWVSELPYNFVPGDTTHLTVDLYADSTKGISRMKVMVFNTADTTDFVEYILTFLVDTTIAGVNDLATDLNNSYISEPFPNPASDFVRFNYNIPGNTSNSFINIYDIFGSKVASYPVMNMSTSAGLNISNLSSGVYYYRLETNGTISSQSKTMVITR